MKRLKQKDLKDFRLGQLLVQGGTCPLCKTKIKPEEAVLDHDHDTGHVRGVLHRSCNSSEGRILSWAKRSRDSNPYHFLKNLVEFHEKDHSDNPIHPKHMTEAEKELKKLKKHQKKLKTQRGRDKVQLKIDSLLAMEDRG